MFLMGGFPDQRAGDQLVLETITHTKAEMGKL